jgi:hypothetical protein
MAHDDGAGAAGRLADAELEEDVRRAEGDVGDDDVGVDDVLDHLAVDEA